MFRLAAVIGALLFAERTSRAYKDINLLGCKLLAPGGLLMTYSCSGGIGLDSSRK